MKFLDLSYQKPEENLACDEALLDIAEEESGEQVLRFWESDLHFVVTGSSNRVDREVHTATCEKDGVPILRRRSGGGTVLQGPGCLNYALILRMTGDFSTISGTNATVLGRHCEALQPLVGGAVMRKGFSDLALGALKFSGNAQRRRLRFLMFHGTILYRFDLGMISRYLPFPSKQPEYREGRQHHEFLVNIPTPDREIKSAIGNAWQVSEPGVPPPHERIAALVAERYGRPDWNFRL